MIIDSSAKFQVNELLMKLAQLADNRTDELVSMESIKESSSLDIEEIKEFVSYLSEAGYISVETIGGPYLYGHIAITEKGLDRIKKSAV